MASQFKQNPVSTPMAILVTTIAGFALFLVYLTIIPYLGGTVEVSLAGISLLPNSGWNSSYNTALPQPASVYTNETPIIFACVSFVFLGLLFMFLRGMIF